MTTDLLSGLREKLVCSSFCKGFQISSIWNKQMTVLMKSVFPKSVIPDMEVPGGGSWSRNSMILGVYRKVQVTTFNG